MDYTALAFLVTRSQAGDNDAMSELYAATYNQMYYFALKVVGNEFDAMDVLHNAYIVLVEKITTIKDPQMFVAWFKRVLVNECNQTLRKNNKYVQPDDEVRDLFESIEDLNAEFLPETALQDKETQHIILNTIDTELSYIQKQTVMLFYYDEMKISEIAQITETNENTVKNRLHESRKKLKNALLAYRKQGILAVAPWPVLSVLLRQSAAQNTLPPQAAAGILQSVSNATGVPLSLGGGPAAAAVASTPAAAPAAAPSVASVAAPAPGIVASGGAAAGTAATTAAGLGGKLAAMGIAAKTVVGLVAGLIITGLIVVVVVVLVPVLKPSEPPPPTRTASRESSAPESSQTPEPRQEQEPEPSPSQTEPATVVADEEVLVDYLNSILIPEYGIASTGEFDVIFSDENHPSAALSGYTDGIAAAHIVDFDRDGALEMIVVYTTQFVTENMFPLDYTYVHIFLEIYSVYDGIVEKEFSERVGVFDFYPGFLGVRGRMEVFMINNGEGFLIGVHSASALDGSSGSLHLIAYMEGSAEYVVRIGVYSYTEDGYPVDGIDDYLSGLKGLPMTEETIDTIVSPFGIQASWLGNLFVYSPIMSQNSEYCRSIIVLELPPFPELCSVQDYSDLQEMIATPAP